MRKLASIQKITNLEPIEGADAIEKATVLGWEVVVSKGEFKVGDLCVYCEIDSILPDREEFEFLRSKKFRVKTIKLRGQISQGICFPHSLITEKIIEGMDVTEILGVKKWCPYEEKKKSNQSNKLTYPSYIPQFIVNYLHKFRFVRKHFLKRSLDRTFPPEIPKTDETRVQVMQKLLDKYKGETCYITEKLDGSSITVYRINGKFGVCSRNVDLNRCEDKFWRTVMLHNLEQKFDKVFPEGVNIAMQGELVGPGVQGNKYGLEELDIYFFNIFDISERKYVSFEYFMYVCGIMAEKTAPILLDNFKLINSIPEIVEMASGNSVIGNESLREGIVIRPIKEIEDTNFSGKLVRNRVSFKSINREFLLKHEE